jgi:hypothetical protein
MCNLFNSKSRLKTGYKVLAIKDGKYYSTFTGQAIKVGIVKKAPANCNRLSIYWNSDVEAGIKTSEFYYANFNGKTGAFTSLNDAFALYREVNNLMRYPNYKAVLVKIVFDGIVINGDYGHHPIIAGHTIKSITKVRKVNNITI